MKYKVECTHIVSQLLNIKKYASGHIYQDGLLWYIKVDERLEYLFISEMENHMKRALWWYRNLVKETSK